MLRLRFVCAALAAAPAALAAQTIPLPLGNTSIVPPASPATPAPSPEPSPLPSPLFPLRPVPTPRSTVTPRPSATPRAAPSQRGSATPTPTPRPSATPTPISTPTPASLPTASPPTPSPRVTVTPEPAIETVVLPQHSPTGMASWLPIWAWFAGGAVLLLALAALLLRRRGGGDEVGADDEDWEAAAAPVPVSGPSRLSIELRPVRAGVNLISATVEGEVVVTNEGGAPAIDISAAVVLVGGGVGADAALDSLAARPIGPPAVPPFTLAPGEERRFRAVAVLPLDAIEPLTVAERPMFVPLVAVSARWLDTDARPRRVTRGFAVGVERVDSAKLAPLWLDVPPRTYDSVAARPHGAARET